MTLALALLVGGMVCLGVVAGVRSLDGQYWANHLVAYRLRLPGNLTADDITSWLEMVAGATTPPSWSLLPYPPLALEVEARKSGIAHFLVVPKGMTAKLLSLMRAGLPGARLDEAPEYLAGRQPATIAAELAITSTNRPLLDGRADAVSKALLGSFQPLQGGQSIRYQIIFTGARAPKPIHSASAKQSDASWATYLVEGEVPADAEAVRAARRKQEAPLLHVSVRLGVTAATQKDALALFGRCWSNLHIQNAPGVQLVRRWLPSVVVRDRLQAFALPVLRWPLLLNSRELPGLLAFRLDGMWLPGLEVSMARQLPPAPNVPRRGSVLAESNYTGMSRPLALPLTDRLRHLWVFGPTGMGKSTALVNLALQDAEAGYGFAFVDPKGDAVDELLARLPENRLDDVMLLDPTATGRPIGFNLLGGLKSEAERELAVDHVVHIMASFWEKSWGPRSQDLLRNSLLALIYTKTPDGSSFTLAEVPELLTNPKFRRYVTEQPTVPALVRQFWRSHEQRTDNARAEVIAPLMNKLREFFASTSLRLMLGQDDGIDVGDVFRKRAILLVKLGKDTIGTETAQLFGAVVVAKLWGNVLRRASVPATRRRPGFIYVDEWQDVLRLPLDVPDMLAMARGFGTGLVLANQLLGQLTDTAKAAVLGNVQSHMVFRLKSKADARSLTDYFPPLTAEDLRGLDRYEVALSLSIGGSTPRTMTGRTLPLPETTIDHNERAKNIRQRLGKPRADVEAALRARIAAPSSGSNFGRKTARDEA